MLELCSVGASHSLVRGKLVFTYIRGILVAPGDFAGIKGNTPASEHLAPYFSLTTLFPLGSDFTTASLTQAPASIAHQPTPPVLLSSLAHAEYALGQPGGPVQSLDDWAQ